MKIKTTQIHISIANYDLHEQIYYFRRQGCSGRFIALEFEGWHEPPEKYDGESRLMSKSPIYFNVNDDGIFGAMEVDEHQDPDGPNSGGATIINIGKIYKDYFRDINKFKTQIDAAVKSVLECDDLKVILQFDTIID
jgi:hypothetical protein